MVEHASRHGVGNKPERLLDEVAICVFPDQRRPTLDVEATVSVVGWLVTLLVAIALVVGLVLFFATSGFWGGGGDPPF